MKKTIIAVLLAMMIALLTGCTNPNASPTDKVGGYHVSSTIVREDASLGNL